MDNFVANNINAIRIHFGLNQEKLAQMIDTSQAAVSSWEKGISIPRNSSVMKIVDALPGISYDDVMGKENGFASKASSDFEDNIRDDGYIRVPLFGKIAAGTPIAMDATESSYPVPIEVKRAFPKSFLLSVEGNSMSRILPNGCYALIDPCNDVTADNKPYAVCVNGHDATIKRVRKLNNGFELVPDSTDPTYKSKLYDYGIEGTETITIIGRVVWHCVPFNWDY